MVATRRHWVHLQILEERRKKKEKRRRRLRGREGMERPELKLTSADRMWSEEKRNDKVSNWFKSVVSAHLQWQQAEQLQVGRGLTCRNRWPSPGGNVLFCTPTCSYRNNHLPWLPKLLSEIWCWLTSWETWDRNSFAVDTPGTWRCDFQSHFRLFWKVCYRNQLWPNLLSLKWNAWTLLGRENPVASLPVKRQGRWGQTLKNKSVSS